MRIGSAALLLVLALAGCGRAKPAPPGAAASAAPASAPRLIVSGTLSSASAFELLADDSGLHLLWASDAPGSHWLSDAELGQDGSVRGQPRPLALPRRVLGRVTDLSAALVGQQLALAWVEQGKDEARASATLDARAVAPAVLDLGVAALSAESARGNIAIAAEAEQDRAIVMWRGSTAPCVDPQATPCTGFTFRRLRVTGAETTGLPLSVPVPCASHSVQLSVSPGRFHYGVCTREGSDPVTTMFSIQYRPEYARVEPLLKGCLPLGTVQAQGKVWLVGDCHGKRKAVPVPVADEKPQPEYIDALNITCTPERAELRQGRFSLSLREPLAGLQALLPATLLPSGARAGWTGRSLVFAYLVDGRLQTRALSCQRGKLEPL